MATEDRALRDHLLELLRGGSAHIEPAAALDDFPADKRGVTPPGSPYNAWQLLEHMRLALRDLLDICTDSSYAAPKWPDDYWPKSAQPSSKEWDASVKAFKADLKAFEDLVSDGASNLYAKIPWGEGQTLLREVLLAADHNSYHLGQLVLLRKQLGISKE